MSVAGREREESSSLLLQQQRKRVDDYLAEIILCQALLLTSLGLVLYWVFGDGMLGGLATEGPATYNWHPILTSAGFLLYCQSALVYRFMTMRANAHPLSHHRWHVVVKALALLMLYPAVLMVPKYVSDDPHIMTWMGIPTLIVLSLQWFLEVYVASGDPRAAMLPLRKRLAVWGFVSLLSYMLLGVLNRQSQLLQTAFEPRAIANWVAAMLMWTGAIVVYWVAATAIDLAMLTEDSNDAANGLAGRGGRGYYGTAAATYHKKFVAPVEP